jgi:hypothetical protein
MHATKVGHVRRGARLRATRALSLVVLAGTIASCGSEARRTTSANEGTADTTTTGAPTTILSTDAQSAAPLLLVPADLGAGWNVIPADQFFPNSADVARALPQCDRYAELVFEGGARHGVGAQTAIANEPQKQLFYEYAVIFPTTDAATAMMNAVAESGFADCWGAFNEAAVKLLPYGITDANYHSDTPPQLTLTADRFTVESLVGTIKIGGSPLDDTCVCAFAQVGRGIVEVHSQAQTFDPTQRSRLIQAAIDKLSRVLSATTDRPPPSTG